VIDFIDMVLEANRDLVLRRLTECLARDRTRHQVAEVTSLGLVQMTRKRVGGGLLEHFSTPCEHCRGRGVIVSTEPVAESAGRGGERDRNGSDRDRTGNGDSGGRRRGRGRRDEPSVERPRRLPDAITPDRDEATLDVGAPAPVEEVVQEAGSGAVEPATVESVRDDVEEVVVEQALAAERNRHVAAAAEADDTAATPRNGAVEAVPDGLANGTGTLAANEPAHSGNGVLPDAAESEAAAPATGRVRRRGRVTRTAGAPAAASGEAPVVTVVTVPAVRPIDPPDIPAPSDVPSATGAALSATPGAVDPWPEPAAPARPRRPRRAASRPAGPPAADTGGDVAAGTGAEIRTETGTETEVRTGGDPV
jgi:ribonuclease E